MAICATTSTSRVRLERSVTVRPPCTLARSDESSATWRPEASVNSSATSSVAPAQNAATRQSSRARSRPAATPAESRQARRATARRPRLAPPIRRRRRARVLRRELAHETPRDPRRARNGSRARCRERRCVSATGSRYSRSRSAARNPPRRERAATCVLSSAPSTTSRSGCSATPRPSFVSGYSRARSAAILERSSLGRLERNAGLEPRHGLKPIEPRASACGILECSATPKCSPARAAPLGSEPRRRPYTAPVEANALAHDAGVGGETRAPKGLRQDDERWHDSASSAARNVRPTIGARRAPRIFRPWPIGAAPLPRRSSRSSPCCR